MRHFAFNQSNEDRPSLPPPIHPSLPLLPFARKVGEGGEGGRDIVEVRSIVWSAVGMNSGVKVVSQKRKDAAGRFRNVCNERVACLKSPLLGINQPSSLQNRQMF